MPPWLNNNESIRVISSSGLQKPKHCLRQSFAIAPSKFNLENQRPKIQLRNRGKIKFKVPYTTLTKVQNSPFYRGAKLWERLPEGVQKPLQRSSLIQ